MQQFLIALAVCHTVKTEIVESTGKILYQVSNKSLIDVLRGI